MRTPTSRGVYSSGKYGIYHNESGLIDSFSGLFANEDVNDTDNNIKIRFGAQLEGDDEIKNPFEDDDFVGSDTLEQFTKTLK